jgi:hypothetical protein
MREEETIDDRALRLFRDAETTHHTNKRGIIPLIPFDNNGANIVIRYVWPSECRYLPRTYPNDDLYVRREARLDVDCDERKNDLGEEFMGDRETIVSLEDMMHLDQLRIGYNEHDIVHISYQSEGASQNIVPLVECNNKNPSSANMFSKGDMDYGADIDPYEVDDILKPICGPIITPTQSFIGEEGIISRLETSHSNSTDSDVSSVFSTSSIVSIMRLKDRKRRLERFLSEKSFESAGKRSFPTSLSAEAC